MEESVCGRNLWSFWKIYKSLFPQKGRSIVNCKSLLLVYIYTVRLPHPWSGYSQGRETFLAFSADKQSRHFDTECSNHHPSLSTLRSKGLSRSKMQWSAVYTNFPVWIYCLYSFHPHPTFEAPLVGSVYKIWLEVCGGAFLRKHCV